MGSKFSPLLTSMKCKTPFLKAIISISPNFEKKFLSMISKPNDFKNSQAYSSAFKPFSLCLLLKKRIQFSKRIILGVSNTLFKFSSSFRAFRNDFSLVVCVENKILALLECKISFCKTLLSEISFLAKIALI